MIVVSDTSPVNYLILIGEIEVLRLLYQEVILPEAVFGELTREQSPEMVHQWVNNLPEWVVVRTAETPLLLPGLGPGESEAITLALALSADLLLIDERKGRQAARTQGLAVTGILGVLEQAATMGWLDLPSTLEKLRHTSFHVAEHVLIEMLVRDTERRGAEA